MCTDGMKGMDNHLKYIDDTIALYREDGEEKKAVRFIFDTQRYSEETRGILFKER